MLNISVFNCKGDNFKLKQIRPSFVVVVCTNKNFKQVVSAHAQK